MKKLKLVLTACAMAVAVAACSTPTPTTVIGFNYEIDNARANGIVQVFDLSGNTVVQIRDLNPKTVRFFDDANSPIPFKVMGETAVLSGVHSSFTVSTRLAASRVVRKISAPLASGTGAAGAIAAQHLQTPATSMAQEQVPAPAPDSDAALTAEIARIRKEIAELKTMMAATARDLAANPARAAEEATAAAAEPRAIIVSFPNNSSQFNPGREQREQLLAISRDTAGISVRGYTDSDIATPSSIALAKARAEAAKRYLISMGVTATKISTSYDGAGKFIVENRSPSGRATNRRVEIVTS